MQSSLLVTRCKYSVIRCLCKATHRMIAPLRMDTESDTILLLTMIRYKCNTHCSLGMQLVQTISLTHNTRQTVKHSSMPEKIFQTRIVPSSDEDMTYLVYPKIRLFLLLGSIISFSAGSSNNTWGGFFCLRMHLAFLLSCCMFLRGIVFFLIESNVTHMKPRLMQYAHKSAGEDRSTGTCVIGAVWPTNMRTGDAFNTSHRIIVASSDALITPVPSRVIRTFVTEALCPLQVAIRVPISVDHGILQSHRRISLSSEAVATIPSPVIHSCRTARECAAKEKSISPAEHKMHIFMSPLALHGDDSS